MRRREVFVVIIVFLFGCAVRAVNAAGSEKSQLSITLDGDSLIIAISGNSGESKSISIFKDQLNQIDTGHELMIHNELYIGDDKIIIDGVEYAPETIDEMLISRRECSSMTFKAKLPDTYRDEEMPCKVIKVSRADNNNRIGFSGLTVSRGEEIYGDVVALTGDIKVFGKVYGDVVSLLGNVFMYDSSYAEGDVVAPLGQVITEGQYKIKGKLRSKDRENKRHIANLNLSARFNRVEGFTPLINIGVGDSKKELPKIDFSVGYGLALKRWNIDIGFKQNFGSKSPFYMGGNLYRGAFTADKWYFSEADNTVAGLFFKEDFHDFYMRKGGRLSIGREFRKNGFVQAEYTAQTNSYLTKHTNSAIFGGRKKFRENYSTILADPAALASLNGELRMLGLRFGWDSRIADEKASSHRGQHVEMTLETTGDGLLGDIGGDFSYNIAEINLSHYQPVTPKQYVGFRLRGGLSNQQLPLDRRFFLGGVGSLRGYDFKEFEGNRYFLANVDYYWQLSNYFSMSLFTDLGQAGFSKKRFERNGLKSDVGLGFQMAGIVRIDMAQRLDNISRSPVITGRIETAF